MKIKTFKFWMSNSAILRNLYNDRDQYTAKADIFVPVYTCDEIDKKINSFIKGKDVVNIIINDFTVDRHNNGRSDTIQRTYTILYNN